MKKVFIAILFIAIFFLGCTKEDERETRNVYTLSNQTTGNTVIVFDRALNGSLILKGTVSTGGNGSGAGLGSQGALTLSHNKNWLFAVNAGSNDVSVFKVKCNGLTLAHRLLSGGTSPISITNFNQLVYVLNNGASPNISGFYLSANGSLSPIPNSTRELTGKVIDPAQVSFTDDGAALVITEKAANKVVAYNITSTGTPGSAYELNSSSPSPFGFAVGKNGNVYVSEAGQGALSVYHIGQTAISLVDGPVFTHQSAPCWVVLTEDERYVYVANAASNSISGYSVNSAGQVVLLNANGITGATGASPIDEALSSNSKFLYVVNSGSHNIRAFTIGNDGSLTLIGDAGTLPVGAVGLAAL